MYIGISNVFFDLNDVKFIKIKNNSAETKFTTFDNTCNFEMTEKSFVKILNENTANFIKLVQEGGLDNTRTVFYINFDKVSCFINYEKYKVAIKFKKSYFDDKYKEDSIYIDSKLSNSEFEMLKAKIAKNKNFINA